jgi:hypothetical protein
MPGTQMTLTQLTLTPSDCAEQIYRRLNVSSSAEPALEAQRLEQFP